MRTHVIGICYVIKSEQLYYPTDKKYIFVNEPVNCRTLIKTQMKNMFYWAGIISILICLPLRVSAQSYEQMWKQVEALEQKQLPKSAIKELQKIYEHAKQEKNMPQMMRAHLTKASLSINVTPDSLDRELSGLKTWVAEEKDPVYKAILNHLLGYYTLDTGKRDEAAIDAAIAYFRLSLQDKDLLSRKSAADYHPMTVSKELSATPLVIFSFGFSVNEGADT